MKKRFARSNAFLLEIVLDILIFAIMLTVSLHMIMKSHALTKETNGLYQATELCESIADIYETGDGSLELIYHYYPDGAKTNYGYIIYIDSDFQFVGSKDESSYQLKISDDSNSNIKGSVIIITFVDDQGNELYTTKGFCLSSEKKEVMP